MMNAELKPNDATARLFYRFNWPRLHLGLLALACLIFSIVPLVSAINHPNRNKDYVLWYYIGNIARLDGPLYPNNPAESFAYMYPPTLAIFLCAPLSVLPEYAFVFVLVALNSASWLAVLYLAAKVATGRSQYHHPLVYVVPFVATVAYVYDSFLLGQINLSLLLPMLGAILALRAKRDLTAGALLALAASIKVFPLSALAYFIVRRRWRAAGATIATLVTIWFILPAPIRGFERNLNDMQTWFHGMLGDQSGEKVAQRSNEGFSFHNQSLISVTHRLLRSVTIEEETVSAVYLNIANVSPQMAQLVGFGFCVFLGLMLLATSRHGFARTPTAEAAEWGMVLLLAVICSPLAWTYFYVWTLPAWATVAHVVTTRAVYWVDRRKVIVLALVAIFCFAAALTEQFDHRIQGYGITCWGGVALFFACACIVRGEYRRTLQSEVPPVPAPMVLPILAA